MKKQKTVLMITIIIIILISIYIFFQYSSNNYLIDITESEIEKNDRKIIFQDKPKNTEELVVANYYLSFITGDFSSLKILYPTIPEAVIKNEVKSYSENFGYKYIEIRNLKSMSEEDIHKEMDSGENLVNAAIFNSGITFQDYIIEHDIDNYKIVKIEYYFEYTDKTMEGHPQYPPGETTMYYLLEDSLIGKYVISTRTIPRW